MYLWTNDLANQGKKTMEKKNVSFTKDGMKVGVKEMSEEEYADRTQRYGSLFLFCLSLAIYPLDPCSEYRFLWIANADIV
jgi:hypothetical protein